jgi:hypothetical protein
VEEQSDDPEADSDNDSPPEDSPSNYEVSESSDTESVALTTDDEATEKSRSKRGKRGPQISRGGNKKDTEGTRNKSHDIPESKLEELLKDKQLWKEGVGTGLGPGKEVFIKKPKSRDPGTVPYQEHTLHPNTFLFLVDLAENNERAWFKGNS